MATVVAAAAAVPALYADGADTGDRYLDKSMPGAWQNDDARYFDPVGSVDKAWWRTFDDPLLDSLIEQGVEHNYNVLMAVKRMEVAKNTLNATRGEWLPTVTANFGWQRSQASGRTGNENLPTSRSSAWSGSVDMSWQVDIFGKIASQAKADKALFRASRDQWAGTMLSLEAQIADTYFRLRSYQAQMEVALSHSTNQLEVMKMTEARYESGLASKLDVAQAKRVYYSTKASIPALQSSIRAAMNSIAVLLGEYPQTLYPVLEPQKPMPEYIHLVASGMPMELLERRPDVRAAREQIIASAAQAGMARKDFLPSLSINGSLGTAAHNAGDLFTSNSYTWSVAPTLSWTIFDGLSRKYNLASAKEQLQSDIENYNLTVLTAVEETDNAMNSYMAYLQYIASLDEVVAQSDEALRLSVDLYKLRLSAFVNVVDAQLTCLESRNSVITAKYKALISLVNLYKALGGGWTAADF